MIVLTSTKWGMQEIKVIAKNTLKTVKIAE